MQDDTVTRAAGLRGLIIDAGLPWLALQVMERLGVPTLEALGIAAIFPVIGLFSSWRASRSVDIVAAIVLASLAIGLIVALFLGDARFALMKAAPAIALFGIACLVSLSSSRPLMFFVARHFAPGDAVAKATDWNQRLSRPGFRAAMRQLTLVWGLGCLLEASAGIAVAFLLPLYIAVVAEPTLAIGTLSLLLAWTRRFARARAAAAPAVA